MKKDNKKALYESIMTSVAREVKKTLNERYNEEDDYVMDADEIEMLYVQRKPDRYMNDSEQQWYYAGLKEGLKSAKRKLAEFGVNWDNIVN